MNAVELIGRMLLALLVVLGLMWALAKFARRPLVGKADQVMNVLARQQLNRNASVAVIKVMDRALVVGVTDQGVRLLSETELGPIEAVLSAERPRKARAAAPARHGARELAPIVAPVALDAQIATPVPPVSLPGQAELVPDFGALAQTEGAAAKSALDGSILSPRVWSQLVSAARDVTVRR